MKKLLAFVSILLLASFGDAQTKTVPGGAGSGGGVTVGNAITGGAANRVLYEDSANKVGESAGFTFDGSTVTIGTGLSGTSKALIVDSATSTGNPFEVQDAGVQAAYFKDGGYLHLPAGSLGTASITLGNNSTNTGFYDNGSAQWTYQAAGTSQMIFTQGGGIDLGSGKYYGWDSASSPGVSVDTQLQRYAAGVVKLASATGTDIRGLMGGGTTVASATALPVPTGRVFHVSGTTTITSITSTNFAAGAVITLIFDGVLTFTDGSNLKLAGDFTTAADATITLVYDGTNWFETSRSTN